MNGKTVYFAAASFLGVLCSTVAFLPFFLLTALYLYFLLQFKRFSITQLLSILSLFLLFFLSSHLAVTLNQSKIPPSSTLFTLEFIKDPTIDGNLLQITGRDLQTHEKLLLQYKIKSEEEKKSLQASNFYGSVCSVSGSLKLPQTAKNQNAFNYREYLNRQQIYWILESSDPPLHHCGPEKLNAYTLLMQIRFNGITILRQNFPLEVAALSAALIFGDESLIPPEQLSNYQNVGISHLLAISGLHVSLLIGMIFLIGIRAGLTRETMTRLLLILLPVYVVLAGGSPSVYRSVLMVFPLFMTARWGRQIKLLPIDALGIAFILMLFMNPFVIFNIGFQLSFSVSASIILSSATILKRYPSNMKKMLAVSVISQFSSLPFLLYHFFGVSFIGIIANCLFIPLYSFIFLPAVFILFFIQIVIGTVPQILMKPFASLVQLSIDLTQKLSLFSIADFTPGRPELFFLLLDFVLLFFIFICWERVGLKRKKIIISALCIALFQIQGVWNQLNPIGEVSMIDVGQGDSILIHLPFNEGNYLIDTGGSLQFNMESWQKRSDALEVGKDIVVPFLKGKGITVIDKLILSHGDADHIGGTLAIMKEVKIEQIVMPAVTELSDNEKEIIQEAEQKGIQVVQVSAGDQWETKECQFFVLNPEQNFTGDRNQGSMVVLARIGGLNWFFGGDLDQAGEENIAKVYPNIKIDVLKAGHHGSKTSTSEVFLQHFKPKVALISVGEKNRFGHPHQEVIEHLKNIHASVYRTDKQGEISYHFFHDGGTFTSFLP